MMLFCYRPWHVTYLYISIVLVKRKKKCWTLARADLITLTYFQIVQPIVEFIYVFSRKYLQRTYLGFASHSAILTVHLELSMWWNTEIWLPKILTHGWKEAQRDVKVEIVIWMIIELLGDLQAFCTKMTNFFRVRKTQDFMVGMPVRMTPL